MTRNMQQHVYIPLRGLFARCAAYMSPCTKLKKHSGEMGWDMDGTHKAVRPAMAPVLAVRPESWEIDRIRCSLLGPPFGIGVGSCSDQQAVPTRFGCAHCR